MTFSATYSPDDNKLRLYSVSRLDAETYARARKLGFRWAPRQQLFVAPTWTPAAEDFLLELAGSIDDEDTSLTERAEQRAEAFEGYSSARARDAEQAQRAVAAIADNIPLGQPILVGHHSERHARRDAERIESGMRRAVRMWDTSQYWVDRAAGALRHAKYKELPQVRARRIKKIEADRRRQLRGQGEAERMLKAYTDEKYANATTRDGRPLRFALLTSFGGGLSYEAQRALETGAATLETALAAAVGGYQRYLAVSARWVAHYDNRLAYEKAMLAEAGASQLLERPKRAALPPLCNYRAPDGITAANPWSRGETIHYPQVEMTSAEYAKIYADYKGTRVVGNSHRVRTAYCSPSGARRLVSVFLTDSKVHERPADVAPMPKVAPAPRPLAAPPAPKDERAQAFDAMRESLRSGVKVVTAPELFVTPAALAARMVEELALEPGMTVLEPSAGTGALVKAVKAAEPSAQVTAVELNHSMAQALGARCADFLDLGAAELGYFDRVVMNPPFSDEVAHVEHAAQMLKPCGRLVAVMSAGVSFRSDRKYANFRAEVDRLGGVIEPLPDGTFSASGTEVRTVLVIVDAAQQQAQEAA